LNQFFTEIVRSSAFWPVTALLGFLALLFIVSVWERRLTRPYKTSKGDAKDDPEFLSVPSCLPEYVRIMSDALYTLGFNFDQLLVHAKTPMVRITATVWFSPARDILVLSGAGTVLKMPSWQTWLFSPLQDGRTLVTTDNNDEGDHSGMYVVKRIIGGDVPKLLTAHRARLEGFGAQATVFVNSSAAEALSGIYQQRVDRMIKKGIVRYVDADGVYWRYNVWGGLRMCIGFFVQTAQTLPQFWRVKRRPIGSHESMPLPQTVAERYSRVEKR
jgi:hypothetical protein